MTDWMTESNAAFTSGRSAELQAIDDAVSQYTKSGAYTMRLLFEEKITYINVILDAIRAWKLSKARETSSKQDRQTY